MLKLSINQRHLKQGQSVNNYIHFLDVFCMVYLDEYPKQFTIKAFLPGILFFQNTEMSISMANKFKACQDCDVHIGAHFQMEMECQI